MTKRTVGVVTVGRSDFGIILPILKRIQQSDKLKLQLIVAGSHLSPEYGMSVNLIEKEGFSVDEKVEMLLSSDSPEGIAKSMGIGACSFSQIYARSQPDLLCMIGDRFEMHSAAIAALPFNLPIAHIHGGELTSGAFDDALRHSITKLSHLHFVTTKRYAARVRQLGEEDWRIHVCGAPSLDNLESFKALSSAELRQKIGIVPEESLLVTFHPPTLEEHGADQLKSMLSALESVNRPILFTMPNEDTGGREFARLIEDFCSRHTKSVLFDNLGTRAYFSMMSLAVAMVGNSSSGIIEAPSFKLPVVNIGTRQDGRLRAANVIDVECQEQAIRSGIQQALDRRFRESLSNIRNPYFSGGASKKVVEVLESINLNQELIRKRFFDLAA